MKWDLECIQMLFENCSAECCPDRSTQKLKPYKSELPRLLRTEQRGFFFFSERRIICGVVFLFLLCVCVSPLDGSLLCPADLHVTANTMRLRMRKASQQPNPSLASRPSRTKRRHSEVEEDTPTSGGRGLFSTIKKFIRGNAVKVMTFLNRKHWFSFFFFK